MSSASIDSRSTSGTATAVAQAPEANGVPHEILNRVIEALEASGDHNLASALAGGAATLEGSELVITVGQPASVIPYMMSAEQRKTAALAASAAAGRAIRVTLAGGAVAGGSVAAPASPRTPHNGGTARGRASEDPVVQRMREKFGAEIRTVIDHREKN
jgi:DNA polymerase-3 subunit gamma/tau